jgi:hypothetical protein
MPRTLTTKVYKFDELSDEAKEKARVWFRDGNLDYEWYDGVEEDFKTIGKLIGIEVKQILFSGFYSQGDGACFEGTYHYGKDSVKKLIEYAPKDEELHRIVKGLYEAQKPNNYLIHGTIKHRGQYYHYNSTEIELYREDCHGNDLHFKGDSEKIITELLRDLMKWLYRILQKEYDYLNSDEQVDETIRINEYEFTEDGRRSVCIH